MKTLYQIIFLFSIILGSSAVYSQDCTNCPGESSNNGINSSAIGHSSISIGNSAFASGFESIAEGSYSTAMGFGAWTESSHSIALGKWVKATGDNSIVIGSGVPNANIYLENSDGPSFMVGFSSRYPTLYVSDPYVIGGNFTETGRVGIGNVTEPEAKLHLQADAGETAAIFIQPDNWLEGESANLALGTLSYGITSDKDYGFVFRSANDYLFKDGKMGIGSFHSKEPEAKLHIKSSLGEEASIFIEPFRDDIEGGNGDEKSWSGNLYLGTKTNILSGVTGLGLLYTTSQYHAFQGGNVGIGVLEPEALLHVQDQSGALMHTGARTTLKSTGSYPATFRFTDGLVLWDLVHWSPQQSLNFKHNYEDKMIVSAYNGVWADDMITVTDLNIDNIEVSTDAYINVIQAGENQKGKAAEFKTADGEKMFFVPKLSGWGYSPLSRNGDAGIFWSDGLGSGGQNASGGFVIAAHYDGAGTGIKIDGNGNVGIGTGEPDAKLDVNGKLQVTGSDHPDGASFVVNNQEQYPTFVIFPTGQTFISNKLWAQEIEVLANVDWPDFVFSESYKLTPLGEVESFIKENNHLPDVPSQEEVAENGINLGEMDALLLQKIEELTLYIIEQDKKIDMLNERIEDLSNYK